ncbi:MAG: hypothetical protein KTR30_22970 [Saprospiraceae bacterium]|nr:hypothetical protein [Saprospiraceae bacterium]
MRKLAIALLVVMTYTGISFANIGKAMLTPFHLIMGFCIGYGLILSRKNSTYTWFTLVVFLIYVVIVNIIQYPNIRYTSVVYTLVYGLETTILYNMIRRCPAGDIVFAFKLIIYSYAVNLFFGFAFDTIGFRNAFVLKYIKVYYHEGGGGGRPMGFSSEPSYAAFMLSVAFLCYAHMRDHARDKPMFKVALAYMMCILLSKSAYGFIFVAVNLMDWAIIFYKKGDAILRKLFPYLGLVAVGGLVLFIQNSSNEVASRLSNVSEVLFDPSLDKKKRMVKLQEVDGSAFARIGPTYLLLTAGEDSNINYWTGQGAGAAGVFLADFMAGIIVDDDTEKIDTGIIPAFFFDYGIIGFILLLIFLINCFWHLGLPYWLMFFLVLPNANINTQLLWFAILSYTFVSVWKTKPGALPDLQAALIQ